jgi:hypothetical protein
VVLLADFRFVFGVLAVFGRLGTRCSVPSVVGYQWVALVFILLLMAGGGAFGPKYRTVCMVPFLQQGQRVWS